MVKPAGLDAHFESERDGFELALSLTIPPGTTAALLGPNGAGKSTVVATLAGLLQIRRGQITLDGRTLDQPDAGVFIRAEDRKVGVVFQDYLLFPHLTVRDNVAFGLQAASGRVPDKDDRVRDWLLRLNIDSLADRKPGELSGGQAQRVALARALAADPNLLLLDEPLAALDVATRAELRRVLGDHLGEFAGPRLLITHDPAEAFLLADEIHIVENGQITQVGTAEDIRLRPRSRYAADLAGSNLELGTATDGFVTVGSHRLNVANHSAQGPVLVSIHPRAISLHREAPGGSPRNTWRSTITRIEHYGDRVRVQSGEPLELTAEVTPEAIEDLGLGVGSPVWLSLKATEISLEAY